MSTKPTPLDLDRPAAHLRELSGLTPTELAIARGVARPSVYDAEGIGERISVGALRRLAEAAGFELFLALKRKST